MSIFLKPVQRRNPLKSKEAMKWCKDMGWNCMKFPIYASVLLSTMLLSCSYSSKKDVSCKELTIDEVILNWQTSLKEKGEPFYYGGAYHDDSLLCIWVTENTDKVKKDIWDRCKTNKGVLIRYSENSIRLFQAQIKKLDSLLMQNTHPEIKYYGHYLDEIRNCIVINLGDVSDSNIVCFKKYIMDSPDFTFEKSDEMFFE